MHLETLPWIVYNTGNFWLSLILVMYYNVNWIELNWIFKLSKYMMKAKEKNLLVNQILTKFNH